MMLWNLAAFTFLLLGCLGFNYIYVGLRGIYQIGLTFRLAAQIFVGLFFITPLGIIIWLVVWFHSHPFHLT